MTLSTTRSCPKWRTATADSRRHPARLPEDTKVFIWNWRLWRWARLIPSYQRDDSLVVSHRWNQQRPFNGDATQRGDPGDAVGLEATSRLDLRREHLHGCPGRRQVRERDISVYCMPFQWNTVLSSDQLLFNHGEEPPFPPGQYPAPSQKWPFSVVVGLFDGLRDAGPATGIGCSRGEECLATGKNTCGRGVSRVAGELRGPADGGAGSAGHQGPRLLAEETPGQTTGWWSGPACDSS